MKHEYVDATEPPAEESSAPSLKLILLLVAVVATAVLFFQNGDRAHVEFLWIDLNWPIWTVAAFGFVAGVVLDRLVSWQWRRARRRKEQAG